MRRVRRLLQPARPYRGLRTPRQAISGKLLADGRDQTRLAELSDQGGRHMDEQQLLMCSFCNKDQNEVRKLIAGPTSFICDECVDVCNDIIADDGKFGARTDVTRSITVPLRYYHSAIAMLAGAVRVMHDRFPRSTSVVTITGDNLTLTLKVPATRRDQANVEVALADYGRVLQGKVSAEELLPGAAQSLRAQIERTGADLRRAYRDDARAAGDPEPVDSDPQALLTALGWILRKEIENVEELFWTSLPPQGP